MTCDDPLLVINQEWDVEAERLDALGNLANLFVAMTLAFRGSGFKDCVGKSSCKRCMMQSSTIPLEITYRVGDKAAHWSMRRA
jgi:hypothetical protein